nr:SAM-dependent methyltransferase [Lentibacter algarum]
MADYMSICLQHAEHGYYTTRDPLGTAGDFTTAPEISQMFGELLGLSLAQTWLEAGSPERFTLAELGPGRGTLMADLLRATRGVAGFHSAAEVLMVESSPVLSARQQEALLPHRATWSSQLDLTGQPLFLIANEFFDALPVRQFIRDGDNWRERVIGLEGDSLAFGLTEVSDYSFLTHRLADTQDGDIVEHSAPSQAIAAQIGQHIARHGGVALLVDYGDWRSKGDTFQALKAHEKVSPLHNAGAADLTAHVDFEALALAASPAASSALTPQGVFLERLGITQRAQALASKLSGAALESHIAAHRRLTHPEEMGTLFKVMALYQSGATPPAGLNHGT